eukprot:3542649-Rhodomonas_salina.1
MLGAATVVQGAKKVGNFFTRGKLKGKSEQISPAPEKTVQLEGVKQGATETYIRPFSNGSSDGSPGSHGKKDARPSSGTSGPSQTVEPPRLSTQAQGSQRRIAWGPQT